MRFLFLIFSCLSLFISSTAFAQSVAPAANELQPADVRVLIDVSGSMKKTDPGNLRKPAMELLVQLLPDDSRAGIWTFGQSVNMLMPYRSVDTQWRKEAASKTSGINSVAMFTNIGKALETVMYDIGESSVEARKNIILLTDGVVDINTDTEVNQKERQRILTALLPQLKENGYVIHTIALSNAADQELMKTLSLATDGAFTVAESADDLMSAFLRIFDQAVPAARLPLVNNRFLVDASVQEFTALIFRKDNAAPTVLISPAGSEYSKADAEAQVHWYQGPKYDLITVDNPVAGEWQLKADIDPDSRVTVVSDLQLQMSLLDNNLLVGQPLDVKFFFQEENVKVTNLDFLRLLDIKGVIKRNNDSEIWQIPLRENDPPIDGIYQQPLDVFDKAGSYEVRILIDGKTFKREFKHYLTVISPFKFAIEKKIDEQQVIYELEVTPDPQLIDIANTSLVANIKNSLGNQESHEFDLSEDRSWRLSFTPTESANYSISVDAKGVSATGEKFSESLGTRYFTYPDKGDPLVAAAISSSSSVAASAAQSVAAKEPVINSPAIEPTENAASWLVYGGWALANLLVLGLAYFVYRMVMSKKAADEMTTLEKTLETAESDIDAQPAMQEVEHSPAATDSSAKNKSAPRVSEDDEELTSSDDDIPLDLDNPEEQDEPSQDDKK